MPLTRKPDDLPARLAEAQRQLFDVLDGIAAGHFPPRPAERSLCTTCAFVAVCRKDYVPRAAPMADGRRRAAVSERPDA